ELSPWLSCSGGEFVRLVYRLAHARATGLLCIDHVTAGAKQLVLRRGQLICPAKGELGRETVRALERVAGQSTVRWRFDGGIAAYPPGASLRQFPLARWARDHLEAQVDGGRAQAMLEELAGVRLALRDEVAPDPALCDPVDRRILEVMATPRRV